MSENKTKKDMVKCMIKIPRSLRINIKAYAALKNKTMSEMITEYLILGVNTSKDKLNLG